MCVQASNAKVFRVLALHIYTTKLTVRKVQNLYKKFSMPYTSDRFVLIGTQRMLQISGVIYLKLRNLKKADI